MALSAPVSAYSLDANDNSIEEITYQSTDDEDFSTETSVFAQVGSEYKVTIPKVIVLSGKTKNAQYYVKVEGDIASYETINVVPDETVDLYSINKSVQIGIISQDKTAWTYSTLATDANGIVKAEELDAGKWSGVFCFNIYINKVLGDVINPDHICDEDLKLVSKINATCLDESTEKYICEACGREVIKHETAALGHDFVNDVCSRCNAFNYPEIGTKLENMSFKQIQRIAQENRTEEYGIKLGDQINVNSSIKAEVVDIGADYIEFMTTDRVLNSSTPYVNSYLTYGPAGYNGTTCYGNMSMFYRPIANYNNAMSGTVCYNGSYIQQNLNSWLNSQTELKSVVKARSRTYDTARLTYNSSADSYSQSRISSVTINEYIYIPTTSELQGIYKNTVAYNNSYFWTATTCNVSNKTYRGYSTGAFYYANHGTLTECYTIEPKGSIAIFTIG